MSHLSRNEDRRWIRRATCLGLLSSVMLAGALHAFTVEKNVNSGEPPVEKRVLFTKGQADSVTIEDKTGNTKTSFTDDGAIQVLITGSGAIEPTITFKDDKGKPITFDATKHQYLLVRMKLEGDIKRTFPNGKVTASRPDNLWMALRVVDANGNMCGAVNIASVTDDEKTPSEMTTLKVPMLLVRGYADADSTQAAGVRFLFAKTHDYNNRDFRLIVEHIAVAD